MSWLTTLIGGVLVNNVDWQCPWLTMVLYLLNIFSRLLSMCVGVRGLAAKVGSVLLSHESTCHPTGEQRSLTFESSHWPSFKVLENFV